MRGLLTWRLVWTAALLLVTCSPETAPVSVNGSASDGLVFVRREAGQADLFRARLSDGAVTRLRATPDAEDIWPYWSQGAGQIVFQTRPLEDDAGHRLVLFDPSSGVLRPLNDPPSRHEHWPVWSPEGDRVAYTFAGRSTGGPPVGVEWVDVSSGEASVIAAGSKDTSYYRAEFSPDGRRLIAQRSSAPGDSTLWILEAGVAPRALSGETRWVEQKGRFTRDGQWIIFTRRDRARAPGDLVLIRPGGSDARRFASSIRSDDHTGRASPTRDEIVFISNRRGNPDAYRVPLAGGMPTRLTRTPARAESAPRWSPDGERIALTVQLQDESFRVLVIDRAGRVQLDVPGMMPDWMPPWP